MTDSPNDPSRRDLLKGAALAGAGIALGLPTAVNASAPTHLTPIALPQPERVGDDGNGRAAKPRSGQHN